MGPTHVWSRIRERKLVRWSAAYLAAAWLALQLIELVDDIYGLAPGLLRSAPVLLGAGFLAAIVLAWYHGEKDQQRVSGIELGMLGGILVLAAVGVAFVASLDVEATPEWGDVERASVAVVPFDDMSPGRDQAYLSDGITEQLLHTLAQIPGLKVPARTSSFAFKGRDVPVAEIGRELGVAHVLEGSVQLVGDRVRITAQLIDARRDRHIWSEQYDRPFAPRSVFAIQEEIAAGIVRQLRLHLEADPPDVSGAGTDDLAAYRAYLRGQYLLNQRDLDPALQELRHAAELDPAFPEPHAGAAELFAIRFARGEAGSLADSALAAARRALALDPDLAGPHAAVGLVHVTRGAWDSAGAALGRALARDPSLSSAHHWYGWYAFAVGRTEEAEAALRRAVALDPLVTIIRRNHGIALAILGRYDDAIATLRRGIEIMPDDHATRATLALVLAQDGRRDEALAILDHPGLEAARGDQTLSAMVEALALAGDTARARTALARLEAARGPIRLSFLARAHASLGDNERAIEVLEQAYEAGDPILILVLRWPAFDRIRSDPRVRAIFERAGL